MESLIVILSLLALSSISSADIMFACDTNSLTCPSEGGIFANCNSTSDVIMWEASLNNNGYPAELNFSDATQINETVIVNGIEVTFVKLGMYSGVAVSFAVIPSPNASLSGLELTCTDFDNTNMTETCTLDNFFDSNNLPPPQNLSFNLSSITDNSIVYSWNPPAISHSCSSNEYRVRIRVNGMTQYHDASEMSQMLTEMGEAINKEHCLSVATIGKDDKPGTYTPEECITIDRPTPVVIAEPRYNPMYKPKDMDPMRADITMSWSYVSDSRPSVMWYYVTHNFYPYEGSGSGDDDGPTGNPNVTMTFNSTVNWLEFNDVLLGTEYTFSVIANNVLGNGSKATFTFTAELPPMPAPTTTTVVMMPTSSAAASPTATPTEESTSTTLPVWAIAVIAVGGAIVLAMILAVVVIIICCVCCGAVCAAGRSKKREEHEMHGTKL